MEGKRTSLVIQIVILFAIGILATGVFIYFMSRNLSDVGEKEDIEQRAKEVTREFTECVTEYPAYEWLLSYWYNHPDDMDIEYDVDFKTGTETEKKCRQLQKHHPDLQLEYADTKTIEAMSAADQKLYAEIIYSWTITRLNYIKRSRNLSYLFCVVTDGQFRDQFFLLSAADEGAVRGTEYLEVYPLGLTTTVSDSLQQAMQNAYQNRTYLADAGDYVDYYSYLGDVDGKHALIGLTYELAMVQGNIWSQTRRDILFAMCMQVLLALICIALLFNIVLHPLKEVQQNIRLYEETKDSETVVNNLKQVVSRNEIGQLRDDVIHLTGEMEHYIQQIELTAAAEERIKSELDTARGIQAAMMPCIFPPFPERHEFSVYASMEPAREIGGDFYDFFMIDDDHLGIVIADVSGKGIPAALFMMASKIIIQSCAMIEKSASEVLNRANELICSNNQNDMFVTVWTGILEISTGRVRAANAGHEYPAIKRADGNYELFKDKHGFVIGGMEGIQYKEYEFSLEPGDQIFLYTDGLPEARNDEGTMFGTDRMLEALNSAPDASPEELLVNVRTAVDGFVKDAEQFDDLTMLCLSYLGQQDS